MSISQFKAKLKGGGARANLFEVELNFPTFAGGGSETESGLYLAKSTQLPPMEVGVIDVNFQGRILPIPGDRTFPEWTVTFYNTSAFELRNAFERWNNSVNTLESNIGLVNPDDYMSDVGVYQLNKAKDRIKAYNLQDAWPSNVGPIELSMDSVNTIEEFTVTFRYVQWSSDTTS